MVEGVRVLIGDSFLTAPIFQKGAEARTGEAASIEEAVSIEEKRLISSRADDGPWEKQLLNAILGKSSGKNTIDDGGPET